MISLPGYSLTAQIYEGSRTLVYRGQRESDSIPVVIKLMRNEYPSFNELVSFRNQYTIAKNIDEPGIVKPLALESYHNGYALVMQDYGGISLAQYGNRSDKAKQPKDPSSLTHYPLPIGDFLPIAIQLAQILDGLYRNRVIHKDIKPANILIYPDTKQIQLIDFSIASRLPRETQEIQNFNVLEGTLAYISPEQTGRMNRGIDYRSDFYSLGVTFYELLTGELPFPSDDPMELVHCHLAQPPQFLIQPSSFNIPPILGEIVMKLMAKNAEDRYQSALGLKYDLEKCLYQWKETGEIESFELGTSDLCDRFLIPEKLYGRDGEVGELLAAFERVAKGFGEISPNSQRPTPNPAGSELLLVAGFSGIGKTAVVNEVHKPIVRQRGYFIKGKFDQFQRNIPFWAFVQAFRDLMEQLLCESEVQLQQWREKILEVLGENGQVLIEVMPELEAIVGKQPAVLELSGSAAQNRFNLLLVKFIEVFATEEHPLVIFLDDLQWADSASLKLMQLLMSQKETGYLLLIGAYRDNEVFPAHPLMLTLEEIQKAGDRVNTMTLAPLKLADLNHLVAETLHCSPELALPLTELIDRKTKGNPFFATQFLKALHEDGLIRFIPPHSQTSHGEGQMEIGGWQCDLAGVKALAISEDVVEFMALQLQKLPPETQEVLKLAACMGHQFDLETLAIVSEQSKVETAVNLWPALQEGLVLPITEVYKFFQDSESANEERLDERSVPYKFLHDRVQQAAYWLISDDRKQETHLKIGQQLLSKTTDSEREERIFEIVNQLNLGVELMSDGTQRTELAGLNLMAGQKAKASTAYSSAVNYLSMGRILLTADRWKTQYDLTLNLYVESTEAAYLNGDFDQMEQLAPVVLKQAKTLLDKVKVYDTQIVACIVRNQQTEAISIALEILSLLGVSLPKEPQESDLTQGLKELEKQLEGREIEALIELHWMTDPGDRAAMQLLSSIISAAYVSAPALLPLIVLKLIDLSVKNGNSPESIVGYCMHGVILCTALGEIESGYQFGRLGLSLLEKLNNKAFRAKASDLFFGLTNHWKEYLGTSLSGLKEGYSIGLETGDVEYAGYCIYKYGLYSFWLGKELGTVEKEMETYSKALGQLKQQVPQNYLNIHWQATLNLRGLAENPCNFIGSAYDESLMWKQYEKYNDFTGFAFLSVCKLATFYLFGEYDKALKMSAIAEKKLGGVTGLIHIPIFHFYDSLTRLRVFPEVTPAEQATHLNAVQKNQKKLEVWSQSAPSNYLHKYDLVEAERNRILGDRIVASEMYDRAIAGAKENHYINEEALANELAAKFYLELGKDKIAQVYLTEAYYGYARWGAKAKVDDLEKCHVDLLAAILKKPKTFLNSHETISQKSSTSRTSISSSQSISDSLDLTTIMKAAQAISGEIELEKLLSILMKVVIENVGAQTGYLILRQDPDWVIEAQATLNEADSLQISCLQSISIESNLEIPSYLIHYVIRTQETLALDDASAETKFAADPYIIKRQPKSVLCTPILNQGKSIGILYLENNLATGVFTADRLEVVTLLSTQAAISLENAILYQNLAVAKSKLEDYSHSLEEKVEERTQELHDKNQHLAKTLHQLKQTQSQLIQTEKMSSLGQIVAGVAHEINNPINFIYGNIKPANNFVQDLLELIEAYQKNYPKPTSDIQEIIDDIDLEFVTQDLQKILDSMKSGADRIRQIVLSLRNFSRLDEAKMKAVEIHEGIQNTLMILQHRLNATGNRPKIQLVEDYETLPLVTCYPSQLNQVFLNILSNAIDALEEEGETSGGKFSLSNPQIQIRTEVIDLDTVKIRISDNGPGIPEKVQKQLFDPFFTTKPVGKGTGLGLSISYSIVVEQHGGQLTCISEPGKGAEFAIEIPISAIPKP